MVTNLISVMEPKNFNRNPLSRLCHLHVCIYFIYGFINTWPNGLCGSFRREAPFVERLRN